jgi:hypothetical protein
MGGKLFLNEKSPRCGAKINIASRNLALVRYCLIKFVLNVKAARKKVNERVGGIVQRKISQ